ncbi:MAG: hypothetical protein HY738_21760 [Bacteroidia bacterium]|nr:hypothetical protein [Bacteroidia bacterium]
MKKILNFFSVFGVLVLCIKYYFADKISLEVAGVCIIVSVILAALNRPVWHFIKAGVAIFSFGLLMVGYSYNMNDFMTLIQPILTMLVALFGIYLMVRSFFRSRNDEDEEHFTYNKNTGKLKKKTNWW